MYIEMLTTASKLTLQLFCQATIFELKNELLHLMIPSHFQEIHSIAFTNFITI